MDTEIKEIRIFSRDEKKQDDMRNYYKNDKLKFYIENLGDTDMVTVMWVNEPFNKDKPDTYFLEV